MASPGTSDFWHRLDDLFNQALDMPPAARARFVDEACKNDERMRAELESLLRSAETSDGLEKVIHGAAHDFLVKKPTLEPGGRVAGYEIISLLGAGGMGRVYLAQDARLRRKVAIKTLPPESIYDRDSLRRFQQEALAASALNHPNILTIYEVGEANGVEFICSEFIDGQTVREKLSVGKVSLQESLDIAIQTATGLTAAHAAGIIHRDIKPENILVRKDGIVKIVDFGIAKLTPDANDQAPEIRTATRPGIVLGTARYMSPEQAQGLPVDARTDIYSLGAVLDELVAARTFFKGVDKREIVAELLKDDAVPAEFPAIIGKALEKDRERRYQSAQELLDELRSFRKEYEFRVKLHDSNPAAIVAAPVSRRKYLAGGLLLAAAASTAGYFGWKQTAARTGSAPIHRLAILPFRNIRQDASTDFLGYSLADAIITKLGYISSITVRPSSSVDQYRNLAVDPRRVGAELDVDTLLTGSFVRDGDDLRINSQLIDVKQMRVIWQDSIDIKYAKLLTVEDRVAQQIISGLELNLTATEAGNLKLDSPANRAAYEDYLRGVDLYAQGDFSSAIEMLERSAKEYPNYALTWAHLGRAYTTAASLVFGGRDMYTKALDAYKKAMALNPNLINARIYMSNLYTDTGRAEEAVPLMRGAIENNRNSAEAHWELGYAYRFGGLLAESIAECERAREIAPAVKSTSSALNTYLYVGNYDKFLATLPPNGNAYLTFYRGFGEFYQRDYPRAMTHFDRAYELDPGMLQAEVGKALAESIRHRIPEGLAVLRETEDKIVQRGVADSEGIYKVTQAYSVLGDSASALRMFRRTINGGFFCYPYFVSDPLIANLRKEPAFEPLLNEAKRRHEAFKARFSR
ncbi:MAG TPA: protein kinase [Bryobacteraceae bacterium]|jgi:serine/threonine protein kinase/Flp pilus assembly protein TadD